MENTLQNAVAFFREYREKNKHFAIELMMFEYGNRLQEGLQIKQEGEATACEHDWYRSELMNERRCVLCDEKEKIR